MGSIDSLEIIRLEEQPPALVVFSHHLKSEYLIALSPEIATRFKEVLTENGATFWLRSVAREHTPFLWWSYQYNFEIRLRVKSGISRNEVRIPCNKRIGKALSELIKKEMAHAA